MASQISPLIHFNTSELPSCHLELSPDMIKAGPWLLAAISEYRLTIKASKNGWTLTANDSADHRQHDDGSFGPGLPPVLSVVLRGLQPGEPNPSEHYVIVTDHRPGQMHLVQWSAAVPDLSEHPGVAGDVIEDDPIPF